MRRSIATVGLLALLFACDKEAPSPAPAPPSASAASVTPPPSAAPAPTPSPSASAAALSAPKCPPGLTGNPMPAYCIKLPPGYTVKEPKVSPTRGTIDYDTGTTTDHLTVTYDVTPIAQLSKDVEGEMKFGGDKLEKKGALPGGNKWFQGTHADYARIVTLVKGPAPTTLKCSFAYQPKKAPPREAIDACKSIVLP